MRRGAGWRAPAGGAALGLAAGWNLANVAAVADEIAPAYGVSLAVVGLFSTALFAMHAAMQLPAGRLADRFGARRVGFIGVAVMGAANLLAMAAPLAGLTVSMRLAAGVGTAICFVSGSAYVRSAGGTAFAQGVFGASGVGGGGLALAIVPQVEPAIGWRAPFVSAVVVAVGAAALLAIAPRGGGPVTGARVAAGELWRDRRLTRFAVVHTASFGASIVLGNWVVTLLQRAGGLSSGSAGAVGSLTLLLGVVSRPLGGWLVRARPDHADAVVAWSFVAGAAGAAVLAVARPPGLALVASAVVGIASGIPFAYAFHGAAAARPDAPGAAIGVINTVAITAVLVGTPLAGLAFSLPGDGRIGFLVVAVLWLGALAAVPLRRPHRRRGEPRPAR